MYFVVKAALPDPAAEKFSFDEETIYGGGKIQEGDEVYIFASDAVGGQELCAKGAVLAAKAGQDSRMSIEVKRTAKARFPLGREDLKTHHENEKESAEAELAHRLYHPATDKICGISELTAAFLDGFF